MTAGLKKRIVVRIAVPNASRGRCRGVVEKGAAPDIGIENDAQELGRGGAPLAACSTHCLRDLINGFRGCVGTNASG